MKKRKKPSKEAYALMNSIAETVIRMHDVPGTEALRRDLLDLYADMVLRELDKGKKAKRK